VRIASDRALDDRVNVEVDLEGPLAAATALAFRPLNDARIAEIDVRDEAGPITVRWTREADVERALLDRAPRSAARIRYVVTFGPTAGGGATSALAPSADPVELRASGRDLLLLPEADAEREEKIPIEVHLRTGDVRAAGASSFGVGLDGSTTARLSDLRRAYFIAGDVGSAVFHAGEGDDFGAWIGFTAFDPRWVSAQTAIVRTAIDRYVGRAPGPGTPPVGILFSAQRRSEPPIVIHRVTRGLLVAVDRRASWTATARLLVAQGLTQRYIGDFLWVGDRSDEPSGWFFSDGFSRAIARDVLFDVELFDAADRASELNALLSATVFSTEPRTLATARGALVATALDVALRGASGGKGSLRSFIRERLERAATAHEDALPLRELLAGIAESAGEPAARKLEAALRGAADVELPADLAGRCYRLVRKELVPFELGFVASAGEEMTVESVKAGSRAEAAGLRAGDVVRDLRYENGTSSVPVDVDVVRAGRKLHLRWRPAGPSKAGRMFERIPGIPDQRC
jgi:hypothetical protein